MPLVAVPVLLLVFTVRPAAQVQATSLAVVDTQWLLMQHPDGRRAGELQAQAQQELGEIVQELEEIQRRAQAGEAITDSVADRFDVLRVTLEHAQARWSAEIDAAAAPAIEAVEVAIESVARTRGLGVVFDSAAVGAGGVGLLVYVSEEADITHAVLAALSP